MVKQIRDVMTRDVLVIPTHATLRLAAEKMLGRNIGPLPVCEGERVVGMITDRDIVVRSICRGLDPSTTRVTEAMSEDVSSCFDDDDLETVLDRMEQEQVRRFIVLNHDDQLVGTVTMGDLSSEIDPRRAGQVLHSISRPVNPGI